MIKHTIDNQSACKYLLCHAKQDLLSLRLTATHSHGHCASSDALFPSSHASHKSSVTAQQIAAMQLGEKVFKTTRESTAIQKCPETRDAGWPAWTSPRACIGLKANRKAVCHPVRSYMPWSHPWSRSFRAPNGSIPKQRKEAEV